MQVSHLNFNCDGPEQAEETFIIVIITIHFKDVSFLPQLARVECLPQGKHTTFGDFFLELTQPLLDQSPSGNHLSPVYRLFWSEFLVAEYPFWHQPAMIGWERIQGEG